MNTGSQQSMSTQITNPTLYGQIHAAIDVSNTDAVLQAFVPAWMENLINVCTQYFINALIYTDKIKSANMQKYHTFSC